MVDSGSRDVWGIFAVINDGIGHADERHVDADLFRELVAGVAAIAIRRTGAENLAFVLFLVGVAAEVVLFFEEEPVFAFQKIGSGGACDATADDADGRVLCGARLWERV